MVRGEINFVWVKKIGALFTLSNQWRTQCVTQITAYIVSENVVWKKTHLKFSECFDI